MEKFEAARLKGLITLNLNSIRLISSVFEPFMPNTYKELNTMLNISNLKWDDAGNENLLANGHEISKAKILFKKIEDSQIKEQLDKLKLSTESI